MIWPPRAAVDSLDFIVGPPAWKHHPSRDGGGARVARLANPYKDRRKFAPGPGRKGKAGQIGCIPSGRWIYPMNSCIIGSVIL